MLGQTIEHTRDEERNKLANQFILYKKFALVVSYVIERLVVFDFGLPEGTVLSARN